MRRRIVVAVLAILIAAVLAVSLLVGQTVYSPDEVLRVIDALQLTDGYSVATPGNWKDGDDVIIPLTVQDPAVIAEKYPKGFTAPRPYLRLTPQPNK